MMFLKKSFWAMLSLYMCLWLVIAIVAGSVLDSFKNVINATLGLTGYRTETIVTEGEDLEYGEMTVKGNVAQTDNASVIVNNGGVLDIGGNLGLKTSTVNVANGTLSVGGTLTGASTFTVGANGKCYITGTANKAPTVTDGGYALINGTVYGTIPTSSEDEN